MSRRALAPIVRQTVAPDPDPAKVEAALDLWRKALAAKLAVGNG